MGRRSKSVVPTFPDDENGDVLRRMVEHGDDITQPRTIDFCFVFADRIRALEFAALIEERDMVVCISYYEERDGWEVVVQRYMLPTHEDVTRLEHSLTQRAESVGGEADGWGCMQVDS